MNSSLRRALEADTKTDRILCPESYGLIPRVAPGMLQQVLEMCQDSRLGSLIKASRIVTLLKSSYCQVKLDFILIQDSKHGNRTILGGGFRITHVDSVGQAVPIPKPEFLPLINLGEPVTTGDAELVTGGMEQSRTTPETRAGGVGGESAVHLFTSQFLRPDSARSVNGRNSKVAAEIDLPDNCELQNWRRIVPAVDTNLRFQDEGVRTQYDWDTKLQESHQPYHARNQLVVLKPEYARGACPPLGQQTLRFWSNTSCTLRHADRRQQQCND